jgi:NAD(P)-dependent dehydrogenase (short-subunit alcohol dehydrogenase family)
MKVEVSSAVRPSCPFVKLVKIFWSLYRSVLPGLLTFKICHIFAGKMSFEGKVVAITGAASGIALSLTNILAERGAKLALADVNEKGLNELAETLRGQKVEVTTTVVDISQPAAVNDWIASTVKHYGQLHGAANIAGWGQAGFTNLEDSDDANWEKTIAVNLSGTFYCLRAELKAMTKGGSIVNVASLSGIRGRAGLGSYVAAKHGVVGLTKTAAREAGSKGVRVNVIAPYVSALSLQTLSVLSNQLT